MNPGELMQLAAAHARAGRYPEAAAAFEQLAAILPGDAGVWCNLGMLRATSGELDGAATAFRRAIDLKPDYADALACLGLLLATRQASGEAEAALSRAARLAPDRADVLYAYTRLLTESGRADEAVAILRAAIARGGRDLLLHDKLCMMMNYADGIAPADLFAAHVEYGRLAPAPRPIPFEIDRTPDRRLRVGYLSPDLREHSVMYFLEPLLEGRDRRRFEVFCYSAGPGSDAVTARARALADGWRDLFGADDEAAYRQIVGDRIDILIELAGHTSGNRLGVMALRPAPVQGTFIGYPNTTGLRQIDFRIVDERTDPAGADTLATERLVRLPGCFLCYRPPPEAPALTPPPSLAPAPVTFGSFNSLAKLSAPTIALWSGLLREVPGSRLMLKGKGLADPAVSGKFIARFADHGIGPDRLLLASHAPSTREHLAEYARVDVALDPFPYNGTTTTCEALWMGVPVITLAGNTHASRVGLSLLAAAGLPEFAAATPEAYVDAAGSLASDPARLRELRSGLRDRIARSRLCGRAAFVTGYEAALRDQWHIFANS